jgi:hypothetical protein
LVLNSQVIAQGRAKPARTRDVEQAEDTNEDDDDSGSASGSGSGSGHAEEETSGASESDEEQPVAGDDNVRIGVSFVQRLLAKVKSEQERRKEKKNKGAGKPRDLKIAVPENGHLQQQQQQDSELNNSLDEYVDALLSPGRKRLASHEEDQNEDDGGQVSARTRT